MPYSIVKRDGGYFVLDSSGKAKHKKAYPTLAAAQRYMRALYANTEDA